MTGPTPSPRERRFEQRRRKILEIALAIAETEGWDAVTTRRLAQEIDYSQPVIYQHFANHNEIIRAVALNGFATLADRVGQAAEAAETARLKKVCRAYLEFGRTQPRLYQAMFDLPSSIPFASEASPPELRRAFDLLADVVADDMSDQEAEATAELVWACCHGLVSLLHAGRIPDERLEHHIERVATLTRGG